MANELISILNNQIEGINQDKLKAEQLAIEKRESIVMQLYYYVDKVREIVESANYLQSLGYRFWDNNILEYANGRIPMKAYTRGYVVGLVYKDYRSNSDTITGVGMFSGGDLFNNLISIEDGDVYFTKYENREIVYSPLAIECDYLLGYSGIYLAQSFLRKLPKFIGEYTDMINNFRHRNYKRF